MEEQGHIWTLPTFDNTLFCELMQSILLNRNECLDYRVATDALRSNNVTVASYAFSEDDSPSDAAGAN
jgi:hypothetical protein